MFQRNRNLLSLFVPIILLFILVVPAKAIMLVDEDYNSLTDGQALPDWTGGAHAQDDEYISPYMGEQVSTNIPATYRNFSLTQGTIIFDFWMKPKVGADTNNGFHIGNSSLNNQMFWNNSEEIWWYHEYNLDRNRR